MDIFIVLFPLPFFRNVNKLYIYDYDNYTMFANNFEIRNDKSTNWKHVK